MKRRTPLATTVPDDLRTFDAARWVQDAIDHDVFLDHLARRLAHEELFTNWYATGIVAPNRYRLALWAAVGQVAADRWIYGR